MRASRTVLCRVSSITVCLAAVILLGCCTGNTERHKEIYRENQNLLARIKHIRSQPPDDVKDPVRFMPSMNIKQRLRRADEINAENHVRVRTIRQCPRCAPAWRFVVLRHDLAVRALLGGRSGLPIASKTWTRSTPDSAIDMPERKVQQWRMCVADGWQYHQDRASFLVLVLCPTFLLCAVASSIAPSTHPCPVHVQFASSKRA